MENLEALTMLFFSVLFSAGFAYRNQNTCEVQDILSCYSALRMKITSEVGFLPLPEHDNAQSSYTRFCKRIFQEKSLCYSGTSSLTSCRSYAEATVRESMYHFLWHTVCGEELQSWKRFLEILGNTEDGRCDRALQLLDKIANYDDCRGFEDPFKGCMNSVAEKIHVPSHFMPDAMRLLGCLDRRSEVAIEMSEGKDPTASSSEPKREHSIRVCEATKVAQCLTRPYKAATNGGRSLFTTSTRNSLSLNDVVTKLCRDGEWSKSCLKSLGGRFCTATERNGLDRLAGAYDNAMSMFCDNGGKVLSDLIKSAHCWDTPGFAQCAESTDLINIEKKFFAPNLTSGDCRKLENSVAACIQRSAIREKSCSSSTYVFGAKEIISAYLRELNCDSSTNAVSATTAASIWVMFWLFLVNFK
ncbi:uncharacterized protein LOC142573216 isoform X1 [Dermacentor variabilis]|uniref:uncharacterized protein LOC142573216 isoform X1 n=1 Tax=Dermacentor variabilis TaxID=34621 RepID=UPI003F5B1386